MISLTSSRSWQKTAIATIIGLGMILGISPQLNADDATSTPVDENNVTLGQTDRHPGVSSDAEPSEGRAPDTFIFPATGDTRYNLLGTNFWNIGDYVEGARTFTVATQSMNMVLELVDNGLTCDTQDHDVKVDGVTIGSFMVNSGETQVVANFNFSQIEPGTRTLRIETTRTVAGGCGSAGFLNDVSTFDFVGVPVELMTFTIE